MNEDQEIVQDLKLIYFEAVFTKIIELNSLGMTLKLDQLANQALEKIKEWQ